MSGQPSPSRSAATRRHRVAAGDLRDARCVGHVGEGAVAAIAIEQVGVGRQSLRAAVDRHPFPAAVRAGAGLGRGGEIEAADSSRRTGRDGRRGRNRRTCSRSPTASRPWRSPAVAVTSSNRPTPVAIQHVLSVGGDEQVGPAVVVEVAGADARGPRGAPQPGGVGHVLEAAVVQVAVEPIASDPDPAGRSRLAARPSSSRVPERTSASSQPSRS